MITCLQICFPAGQRVIRRRGTWLPTSPLSKLNINGRSRSGSSTTFYLHYCYYSRPLKLTPLPAPSVNFATIHVVPHHQDSEDEDEDNGDDQHQLEWRWLSWFQYLKSIYKYAGDCVRSNIVIEAIVFYTENGHFWWFKVQKLDFWRSSPKQKPHFIANILQIW